MKRLLLMPLLIASLLLSLIPASAAEAASSNDLIEEAKSHIGTPYRWGGTTPSGFDCSGFIQYVFSKSGISLPRTTGTQYNTGTSVSKSNLAAGDLVFFNTSGKGVSHAGIYIGNSSFIHSSSSRGIMISSINDPYYWGSRYIGARRVADFSPEISASSQPRGYYATRLEIAETLVAELGLSSSYKGSYFSDVSPTHPKIEIFNAVYEAGIFTGSSGRFMPNDNLTRAQMAKVLVEAYNLSGQKNPYFKDVYTGFWADDYIFTLYYNSITTGYENGYYGINDNVTHGQFSKFIDRSRAKIQ